jgi:plastocyanin
MAEVRKSCFGRPRMMRLLLLVVPLLLVLVGLAAAIDGTLASSGTWTAKQSSASALKDDDYGDDNSGSGGRGDDRDDDSDDRNDNDDNDDNSGHGHGGDDGSGDDRDDDGNGDVARPQIPESELGDITIEIVDEQFVPAEVTIDPGQSVTFINLDDDEHTATGIGFDTGKLNPGDWRTVTFETSGEAPFVCQFHSEMTGMVTVTGDVAASPVASPVASPLALTPVTDDEAAPAAEATVSIVDFAFDAPTLEIAVGTTVTWTNDGQALHTVTGTFADSGVIQSGETFSFTFTEAGTFDYACQLHPQMTGQVVVT